MTIEQRTHSRYRIRRTHGGRRYEHTLHGSFHDAQAIDMAMALSLKSYGVWPPPPDSRLNGLLPTPANMKSAARNDAATLRAAFDRARIGDWATSAYGPAAIARSKHIVEYFEQTGKPHLEDLGTAELTNLVTYLRGLGKSPSTLKGYLSCLSKMFREARKSPALTLYRPDFPAISCRRRRERILSAEEEGAMRTYFKSKGEHEMLDFCELAIETGFRQGEGLRLLVRNARALGDAARAHIAIDIGKTDRSAGTVPLTKLALDIVQRRVAMAKSKPQALLFPNMTAGRVQRMWNEFREHLGLSADPGFTFHCLRHTACSRLFDEGLDAMTVKDFMRHEDLQTTMRYRKTSTRPVEACRSALDARRNRG